MDLSLALASLLHSDYVGRLLARCDKLAQQWQTVCGVRNWPSPLLGGQCRKLFAVMAVGVWGYTPIQITGVLVIIVIITG